MFLGAVRALRAIAARPASLLLAASAIFLAALVGLSSGRRLFEALSAGLQSGALPSILELCGIGTLALVSFAVVWPLFGAALSHVEGGDLRSLWPKPRRAATLVLAGTLAGFAKLTAVLLVSTAVSLAFLPADPASRALLFALLSAPALLLLLLADCVTLGALPLIAERGLAGLTDAFFAVLRAPHRAVAILSLCSLLLTPLLLLATPLLFGALRWPPSAPRLLLLLCFALCVAPVPLLLSKALSEGLLLRQGGQS